MRQSGGCPGMTLASPASTVVVRAARAVSAFADDSSAFAERSAANVARSATPRASSAFLSALVAALWLRHQPKPEPINAMADRATATRSVLNQFTRGTLLVATDTGGAS